MNSTPVNSEVKTLMEQIIMQNQEVTLRNLLEKITKKCFEKCIKKPSSSLDKNEQQCLNYCTDRFQDAMRLVVKIVEERGKAMQNTGEDFM